MDHKQMREQGYTLLSQMLQKPDAELQQLVSSADFQHYWEQTAKQLGFLFPVLWSAEKAADLSEWDREWDLTMGTVKPLAEPIESLYKPWTIDPSCEMTIANQKGWLRGDWAYHMEDILKTFGFTIPAQFAHCPDHLILELEFMSAIVAEAPLEIQLQFLEQHLDWLNDLIDTAVEREAPERYIDLYRLCQQFVAADQKSLTASQATN